MSNYLLFGAIGWLLYLWWSNQKEMGLQNDLINAMSERIRRLHNDKLLLEIKLKSASLEAQPVPAERVEIKG